MTENDLSGGTFQALTRLQKLVAAFVAVAGSAMTIAGSPDVFTTAMLIGIIFLSLVLVLWVNQRMTELAALAKSAVAAEKRCIENLHQRDKLLAVLYFDLKGRSGKNRAPVKELENIVGPDVAKAVKDAAAMLHMTQEIQLVHEPLGDEHDHAG